MKETLKNLWASKSIRALTLVVAMLFCFNHFANLYINQTDSLPFKAFLVLKGASVHKGDYVAFKNPRFINAMIKQVTGTAGDLVVIKDDTVWVGDTLIGEALPKASDGRPLTKSLFEGAIPEGQFFVSSPHPRSFDSRYEEVGLLAQAESIGRAIPLF